MCCESTEDGATFRACLDTYSVEGLGVPKRENQYWPLPQAVSDEAIASISLKRNAAFLSLMRMAHNGNKLAAMIHKVRKTVNSQSESIMRELSGCLDGNPEGKLIFSKEMEKLDESPFHYCV